MKSIEEIIQEELLDYRGSHEAPEPSDSDSPMYDVTMTYGEDIYGPQAMRLYGHFPYDNYSIELIQMARNKPNMQVKIYRAIPKVISNIEKINDYTKRKKYILKTGKIPRDVDNFRNKSEYYEYLSDEIERLTGEPSGDKVKINNGDWVTINPAYAREHGQSNIGQFRVLTKTVSAKNLYNEGDVNEWGYNESISENLNENLNESTNFQEVPNDLYIHFRQRQFGDEANRSHMKVFKAKDGREFLIRKIINQDIFYAYDLQDLQNPIGVAVFDDSNNQYFTGYEHRQSIEVKPDYRRLGIASALTDLAELILGKPYKPTNLQTPEMQGFSKNRLAEQTYDTEVSNDVDVSKDVKFNQNFWRWFGESKVVYSNGEPAVVYHGPRWTRKAFKIFKGKETIGWFAEDKDKARGYNSESLYEVYLSIQKPFYLKGDMNDDVTVEEFEKIIGFKLNRVGLEDKLQNESRNENLFSVWQLVLRSVSSFQEQLLSMGYDGIHAYEDNYATWGVIKSPSQIKSVKNNGEFNPGSNNILKEINPINNNTSNKKLYYHGRSKSRPYSGKYIFITDNLGYASGYSDGQYLYKYTIPFNQDKIFSIKNAKHLAVLSKYVDKQNIEAIITGSGSGQEIDWAVLGYIDNNEYDTPEDLLEHLGFYGVKLKEREGIDSIYIFNMDKLDYMGTIDISTVEMKQKLSKFYQDFQKDKNFLEEEVERLRKITYAGNKYIFDDLLDVGSKKACGYLPLNTIRTYGDNNALNDIIRWAFDNGNEAKIFKTGNVASGALYVWNIKMLEEILYKYKDVLTNANIPIDPDEYIKYIQHNIVYDSEYPQAYKVIGMTFNDKRFIDNINNNVSTNNNNNNTNTTEGVADKYAEKEFNIQDPNREKEQRALTGLGKQSVNDDKGELLGYTGDMTKTYIYANPRSLKDFEASVRAVSDDKGNLFVAQLDKYFYHDGVVNVVNKTGKYPNLGDTYDFDNKVLLHRVGLTNMFGVSDSYEGYVAVNLKKVQDLLDIVESKNPQFKFYPVYYENFDYFKNL
jgi:GNAT superfamily N-acetyltransferase